MHVANTTDASVEALMEAAQGHSSRELTALIREWILTGRLRPGTRLPTVRAFAQGVGMSPSTISGVWARLVEEGLTTTNRRGGTSVAATTARRRPGRERSAAPQWSEIDLATAHPDRATLPDLGQALVWSAHQRTTNSLQREDMTGPLREAVAEEWPFPAEAWTTVSGLGEAALLVVEAACSPEGTLAMQVPATSGTLTNLDALGISVIEVASDPEGPVPESLGEALDAGAEAFFYQPSGVFTVESELTEERLADLERILAAHPEVAILEEDPLGPLAPSMDLTLGNAFPGRVVRMESFCRAFGLDLRTTVIGGSRELVDRIPPLRTHGAAAHSRILQNAVAHLLHDEQTRAKVRDAAALYRNRCSRLIAGLAEFGVEAVSPPAGLLVWLPAVNETAALADLAVDHIVLTPLSRVYARPQPVERLRVATPQLSAGVPIRDLARRLASASILSAAL